MPGTTVTAYMYRMFYLVSFRKVVPEKAMAPHSGTHAWRIPWMEETGRLQSMGSLRVRHDWATSLSCIGKGNGNPPQCSCLENPRDRGAWWAAVYGVAQSWTQLKWLSSSSSSSRTDFWPCGIWLIQGQNIVWTLTKWSLYFWCLLLKN